VGGNVSAVAFPPWLRSRQCDAVHLGLHRGRGLCVVPCLDHHRLVPLVEDSPYAKLGLGGDWRRYDFLLRTAPSVLIRG